jgi:hypothetical protein
VCVMILETSETMCHSWYQYYAGRCPLSEVYLYIQRFRNWSFSTIQVIRRSKVPQGRSHWPRGLRHEQTSPDRTLGSWVRIPLNASLSVCVYSVFLLSCVQRAALRWADPPSKESYRPCKKMKKLIKRPRSKKGL